MASYYSNGKLLLTGEYVVLDGAKSLALPTKFGQYLKVNALNEPKLVWESYTKENRLWLQVEFDLPELRIIRATFTNSDNEANGAIAKNLQNILKQLRKVNAQLFSGKRVLYKNAPRF